MNVSQRPLARKDGLIVQSLEDEVVVYDNQTEKAFVLSPAAAALWKACDGHRTVRDLAEHLNQQSPTTEQVVWYGLGQLNELLEEPVALPRELAGVSRRRFLKMTGAVAAGVTLPLVVKMMAPAPAAAQSTGILCCCRCYLGDPGFRSTEGLCETECNNLLFTCTQGPCAI